MFVSCVYILFCVGREQQYLGTTLTDQNCIYEEIKSRLNSGNACYRLVQSFFIIPPTVQECKC
jgi:hypothetical protein